MGQQSEISISEIGRELGLEPQTLQSLAANSASYYQSFEKPKRAGGTRKINASQGELKSVQRLILERLFSKLVMPPFLHGCIKGRSIVTNARPHVNQKLLIKIDISNFFCSISASMVQSIYRVHLHCDEQAAQALSQLSTFNGVLPQGAPTSPVLANLCAVKMDNEIIESCRLRFRDSATHYTRFVDDITISGDIALVEFLPSVCEIVKRHGFTANPAKTKILRPHTRQWVTGLVVNKKVNPPKKLLRKIRQALYYCRRFGLKEHCETRGLSPERFLRELKGQIAFVRMTQPELADLFAVEVNNASQELVVTDTEATLRLLKHIIDEEQTAIFQDYDAVEHKVAPSEILIDEQGHVVLRAFQLAPEQGWRTFFLADIRNLGVPKDRL